MKLSAVEDMGLKKTVLIFNKMAFQSKAICPIANRTMAVEIVFRSICNLQIHAEGDDQNITFSRPDGRSCERKRRGGVAG